MVGVPADVGHRRTGSRVASRGEPGGAAGPAAHGTAGPGEGISFADGAGGAPCTRHAAQTSHSNRYRPGLIDPADEPADAPALYDAWRLTAWPGRRLSCAGPGARRLLARDGEAGLAVLPGRSVVMCRSPIVGTREDD